MYLVSMLYLWIVKAPKYYINFIFSPNCLFFQDETHNTLMIFIWYFYFLIGFLQLIIVGHSNNNQCKEGTKYNTNKLRILWRSKKNKEVSFPFLLTLQALISLSFIKTCKEGYVLTHNLVPFLDQTIYHITFAMLWLIWYYVIFQISLMIYLRYFSCVILLFCRLDH